MTIDRQHKQLIHYHDQMELHRDYTAYNRNLKPVLSLSNIIRERGGEGLREDWLECFHLLTRNEASIAKLCRTVSPVISEYFAANSKECFVSKIAALISILKCEKLTNVPCETY